MPFTLPQLGYDYSALEPYIDAKTMEIHHTKHHQTYIDKLNKALENYQNLQNKSAEELIQNIESLPEEIKNAVRNHGGGHVNHSIFWQLLQKQTEEPKEEIINEIIKQFQGFDNFKIQFKEASTTLFGSGWVWLAIDKNSGKLEIMKLPNQDNPLMYGKYPLLGIDLWEHAYYLKYQNKRPEYIDVFWNIINWKKVNEYFMNVKNQ